MELTAIFNTNLVYNKVSLTTYWIATILQIFAKVVNFSSAYHVFVPLKVDM